ncbi:MAG: hypothetical protein JW384_01918 [Nitrosomonadaceae bacterium]|nr:hypothetical protein [Nitrosomonadaceae bacterium]
MNGVIEAPPLKRATHKLVEAQNVGPCKIAIVGDAPGEEETNVGKPFVGRTGWMLNKILKQVEIERDACLITNVFRDRPLNDDMSQFFIKKSMAKKLGWVSSYPATGSGYVHPELEPELVRLAAELAACGPGAVVIALGSTALWALTGQLAVGNFRGTIVSSSLLPGCRVIPTYHPTAILRQWENLVPTTHDFRKALAESKRPSQRRSRAIHIYPSIDDLEHFGKQYGLTAYAGSGGVADPGGSWVQPAHVGIVRSPLGIDIETRWDVDHQITCIGFAPSPDVAMVVPFWDVSRPGFSYWSREDEIKAWMWVAKVLGNPHIPKLFQNGSYDIQVLAHWGIKVEGEYEDTMILHHALEPELPKALDYLGSIYTNEVAWKNAVSFKTDKVDA